MNRNADALTLFIVQAVIWGGLTVKAVTYADWAAALGLAVLTAANTALAIREHRA